MSYDWIFVNSYNGIRSLTCSRAMVTGQSKFSADIIIIDDSIAVLPSISLLLFLRHHSRLTTVHLIEHRRGTEIEGWKASVWQWRQRVNSIKGSKYQSVSLKLKDNRSANFHLLLCTTCWWGGLTNWAPNSTIHEGRSHHLRIVVDDTFLVVCFLSALSTSVASLSRWKLIYPLIYEPIPELVSNNKGCVVLTHHSYSYNVFHENPHIDLAAYECGIGRPSSKPYKQISDRLKAIWS